jgi:hypothetical protein
VLTIKAVNPLVSQRGVPPSQRHVKLRITLVEFLDQPPNVLPEETGSTG